MYSMPQTCARMLNDAPVKANVLGAAAATASCGTVGLGFVAAAGLGCAAPVAVSVAVSDAVSDGDAVCAEGGGAAAGWLWSLLRVAQSTPTTTTTAASAALITITGARRCFGGGVSSMIAKDRRDSCVPRALAAKAQPERIPVNRVPPLSKV